jgi:hypothetical protein
MKLEERRQSSQRQHEILIARVLHRSTELPSLHLLEHLVAKRKNERESEIPLHATHGNSDEPALGVQPSVKQVTSPFAVLWPTYPVDTTMPFE